MGYAQICLSTGSTRESLVIIERNIDDLPTYKMYSDRTDGVPGIY